MGQDAEMFAALARKIAKCPLPFLLLMPILALVLFSTGLTVYEVEDQVRLIWVQHAGDYWGTVLHR